MGQSNNKKPKITKIYYGSRPLNMGSFNTSISGAPLGKIDDQKDYSLNPLHHAALKIESSNGNFDIYDFNGQKQSYWFSDEKKGGKVRKNAEEDKNFHWEYQGYVELKKKDCEKIINELKKEYIANYNFLASNCKDFVRQCIIKLREECIKRNKKTDLKQPVDCQCTNCKKCLIF